MTFLAITVAYSEKLSFSQLSVVWPNKNRENYVFKSEASPKSTKSGFSHKGCSWGRVFCSCKNNMVLKNKLIATFELPEQ